MNPGRLQAEVQLAEAAGVRTVVQRDVGAVGLDATQVQAQLADVAAIHTRALRAVGR